MRKDKITIKRTVENDNQVYYELLVNKNPAGAARITEEDNFIVLNSVVVLRKYRRNGFGGAILKYIEDDYRGKTESIILTLNLFGTEDVENLIRFYEKYGYEKNGFTGMKKNLKSG